MRIKLLTYTIVIITLFSSCNSYIRITQKNNENIEVHYNGVNSISVNNAIPDSIYKLKKSDIEYYGIYRLNFNSCDSIGKYIPHNKKNQFNLKCSHDSILLVEDKVKIFYGMERIPQIQIKPKKKIIDIKATYENIMFNKDSNIVYITRNTDNQFGGAKIKIMLGNNNDSCRLNIPDRPRTISFYSDILPTSPGFYILTGQANNNFKPDGFVNLNLGVEIKKIHYTLRFGGIGGTLKQDQFDGQPWAKDSLLNSMHLELGLGYELFNVKYFRAILNSSIGNRTFNVRANSSSVHKKRGGLSYSLGTSIDLKINPIFRSVEKNKKLKGEYWYLKLQGGIYPNYFQIPFGHNGHMIYFGTTIGGNITSINSKYKLKKKSS